MNESVSEKSDKNVQRSDRAIETGKDDQPATYGLAILQMQCSQSQHDERSVDILIDVIVLSHETMLRDDGTKDLSCSIHPVDP